MAFLIHEIEKVFRANCPGGFVKKNFNCMTRLESRNLENWITLNLTWDGMLILDLEIGYDFIKFSTEEASENGFGKIMKRHFSLDPETWNILDGERGNGFSILWDIANVFESEYEETIYESFGQYGLIIKPVWVECAFYQNEVASENGISCFFAKDKTTGFYQFDIGWRGQRSFKLDSFGMFVLRFWILHQSPKFQIKPGSTGFENFKAYLKCAKYLWKVNITKDPFLE